MSKNPFVAQSEQNNNCPRNTHDLSFQNHLTLGFGKLYPVFCKEVISGDSIRVKPTFGLRSLPMVFPVQTRMKAYLHFFYVRNRSLWKDWPDFIFGTKDNLVPPYLSEDNTTPFGTCSLTDYLGVPSRVYGNTAYTVNQQFVGLDIVTNAGFVMNQCIPSSYNESNAPQDYWAVGDYTLKRNTKVDVNCRYLAASFDVSVLPTMDADQELTVNIQYPQTALSSSAQFQAVNSKVRQYDANNTYLGSVAGDIAYSIRVDAGGKISFTFKYGSLESTAKRIIIVCAFDVNPIRQSLGIDDYQSATAKQLAQKLEFPDGYDLSNVMPSENPFLNGKKPLSSLPFRAYDCIFNGFYRNQRVDPFKIDGTVEYNKFIRSNEGGADKDRYDFHYKTWESDVFTTCMNSPQEGTAPMVGIYNVQSQQQIAIRDEDGNTRIVTPTVSADGTKLESIEVSENLEDVNPISVQAAFTQGFTINDLRNVNALQRYLELNQLKGFRYRDLVKGHFNVDIRYDELNYPEFLGGSSKDIYVNPILATARTVDGENVTELGDYAGVAGLAGDCDYIEKYCDEHGFIIGILSVVPVPIYTQNLPRYFSKHTHLDYYTPEFANIGMQPVLKSDLSPLQYFQEDPEGENPTFGYQRPWSEYIRSLDEAHGLFRSQLRNFLMHRVFKTTPELGHDFVTCLPEQLNNIFSTSLESSDKLLGDIYFDVSYKSCVPFTFNPSLQ